MHRIVFLFLSLYLSAFSLAQSLPVSMAAGVKKLQADPQLKHGLLALQVVESANGKIVFSHQADIGLSVASTQKIFTAVAALDLLGPAYRYSTEIWLSDARLTNGVTDGSLIIAGEGDPTLGSWRYPSTTDSVVLKKWVTAIKAKGIKKINGGIVVRDQNSSASLASPIPQGYIWQDIGNYYGAGSCLTNWHENRYEVFFKSGATGKPATITSVSPDPLMKINNLVEAGKAGSGDNAYIFAAPYSKSAYINGTIPPNSNRFSISGALPDPGLSIGSALREMLLKNGIGIDSSIITTSSSGLPAVQSLPPIGKLTGGNLEGSVHRSPGIDSIIYWFLKLSINLYGEALLKTISLKSGVGAFEIETGVEVLRTFWARQGIQNAALHITDGSGLSPGNRVTTASLVKAMQYAKGRPWFKSFYDALPEYNDIKMKSGTINGVKSFAGYIKNSKGKEYTFAIVVNNYDGSASQVVQKLYTILNILK